MADAAIPRDAATVILIRDGAQKKMEVFLMRRHRDQAFMGGAFVFPGGSLDKGDADPGLASYILGLTAEGAQNHLQEPGISGSTALGLYMAAIRETFEEAGILLAYNEKGGLLQFADPRGEAKYTAARLAIYKKTITLKELARQERIRFACDLLLPFAHWITPDVEKKRFNTRFFLARAPEGQIPLHDSVEMTESLWLSPSEALSAYRERKIMLMPPTLKNLEELSQFTSEDELFRTAGKRRIETILPQAKRYGEVHTLLLPHDPDYSLADYKQPPRPGEVSRVAFRDKMWRTEVGTQ
jgi:8-oxo-dGTP pyrophosphatase MutT (NUDIX family)